MVSTDALGELRVVAPHSARIESEVDEVWPVLRSAGAPEANWSWTSIHARCRETFGLLDEQADGLVAIWASKRPRINVDGQSPHRIDLIKVNPQHRGRGLGVLVIALIANRAGSLGCSGVAIPALPTTESFYSRLAASRADDWNLPARVVPMKLVGSTFETLRDGFERYGPKAKKVKKPAGLDQRVDLWLRIAETLREVHRQGVVHRLLRPDVVIVEDAPRPGPFRVTGFDLAKQTHLGSRFTLNIGVSSIGDDRLV